MPREVIGKIPEFTSDEETPSKVTGTEEVKKAETETIKVPEKETETPSVLPTEKEPAGKEPSDDTGKINERERQGLLSEREKLLKEIQNLRSQKRQIRQEELIETPTTISAEDNLQDVAQEDVQVIEKILRAKGYVTREDSHKMFYDSVKQEELKTFLEKHPEYKPESDPHDINWNALQRELAFYKLPSDPHLIGEIMERAHTMIAPTSSDRGIAAKKQRLKVAGVGAGGVQRSFASKKLPPYKRQIFERGGWSEAEIQEIERNLPEE